MPHQEQNQPRPEVRLGGFVPDGSDEPFNVARIAVDAARRAMNGLARLIGPAALTGAVVAPDHMSDHNRRQTADQTDIA